MSNLNVYEDTYRKERATIIIRLQKEGRYFFESFNSGYGLPNCNKYGLILNRLPFGSTRYEGELLAPGKGGLIGYYKFNSETTVYEFFPISGTDIPQQLIDPNPIQLGEVVLDEVSKSATMTIGEELFTFSGIETWMDNSVILESLNKSLTDLGKRILIWKITRIPDTSGKPKLFPTITPHVANEQVQLAVSGFAYDEYGILVYLGMVGYKTSIKSIVATILQSKPFSLSGIKSGLRLLPGNAKYTQVLSPMPEYDSHHCCVISNQAIPGKWLPDYEKIFILHFIGENSIEMQLVDRLNEALTAPILPEWGPILLEKGIQKGFIQQLNTGGDCLEGISIQLTIDWIELLGSLILAEEIAI